MATVFNEFPAERSAFINPKDTTEPVPSFPEVCVTTFSADIIEQFKELHRPRVIASLYTSNGILPVYEACHSGKTVGLFLSRVGAPACAAGLEEVIAMGRTPWLGPLSGLGPEERAMVRAAAERFGVAELLGRDCAQLSEGQRQLVHLARLAVQDAPILLLDEPNSALDFDNTSLLFHRLRELVETGERTALIVLHDPALALRWCGRLLLLDGGRLVEDVATEGMGPEALQAVLGRLYPTIQVRRDEGGRFYCLPD